MRSHYTQQDIGISPLPDRKLALLNWNKKNVPWHGDMHIEIVPMMWRKGVEIIMNARGSSAKYQVLESSSLKCCIVGDTKSGKTALAYRLQAQEFRGDYSATSFDNYSGKIITCFNYKVTWFPPYIDYNTARYCLSSNKIHVWLFISALPGCY